MEAKGVLAYLQLFAHRWQVIGPLLGLPEQLLEQINQTHSSAPGDALRAMVEEWMRRQALTPSWASLVKVLRHLQLEQATSRIEADHGKGDPLCP